MPVTFQVVGNLADFGNDPRAGVKVHATASPGVKVGDVAVHSNEPETVVTDAAGAFTLELVSLPGVWYTIRTPYSNAINTVRLAGYTPDVEDPTTGTEFPALTVINLRTVMDEDPTPGYEAINVSPTLAADGGAPDAAPLPITLRRGTSAEWGAANPVLSAGEPGVDLDTGEQRLGDGVTAWSSLPITGDLAPALAAVDDLHLDGTPAPMRTAGDGLTARRWWQHSGTSGYLDHLTAGAGSGGYLVGYGTDYGAAGGIYVSAKNAGIGVAIQTHASASNMGLRVTAFNKTSYPAHLDLYKGALPWRIAKVKGEAYADGVANGTATFTSATAAFTAGDIGKTLTQTTSRDEGMVIPAGATIAAVGSATSVTLSAPATGTGTAINFLVAGRVPLSTEVLTEWADDDNAPILRIRNRDAVDLYRPDRALEGTGSNRSMVYRQFDRVVFKRWGGAAYQSNAIAVSGTNGHLALIGYDDGTTEPGSETGSVEMIKFKKNQLGFFGATPIARPALGASATDTGTTLALANGIRALLINYGLATA